VKKDRFNQQRRRLYKDGAPPPPTTWETKTAVGGYARIHEFFITDEYDLQMTLLKNKVNMVKRLSKDMEDLPRIKWYVGAYIRCQVKDNEDNESNVRYARCSPITTLREDELEEHVREAILGVTNSFDIAVDEGSSMLFERVEKLEIRVAKLSVLRG